MRKAAIQPCVCPSNWSSQSSLLVSQLCTTRTTQVPPERASTIHSVATVGSSGPMSSRLSATNRCGGSQVAMVESDSMPGPKLQTMEPPSRSSTVVGTNQEEMPGPVAIACQTSSGVPGTSTSASTERRPEASFFTGMMVPPLYLATRAVGDAP